MEQQVVGSDEVQLALEELRRDARSREIFDVTDGELGELMNVVVTDYGFDVSPNFQSLGWGENTSDRLVVNLSDLGNGKGVLRHELRHALHCLICARLFVADNGIEVFSRFVDNVINDPGFEDWCLRYTNEKAREHWAMIRAMAENPTLIPEAVCRNALVLGSILYQHAYYVDPLMCEAVASSGDRGFVAFNGALNRVVGLMIPGEQTIDGYGWRAAQEAFGKADRERKTILIKKADYSREEYFGV